MDKGKISVQRIQPFRKRLSQWTGEKINQWIEPKTRSDTPFSNEPHDRGSTGPVATASGDYPGPTTSHPIMDPDHLRLQFKVSDTS